MTNDGPSGYVVSHGELPEKFPTHKHEALFWESLGRAVATFGFLEETLTKAIFSFTATKPYEEHEIQIAYAKWLPKLERTLSDPLGNLIDTFEKAVRDYSKAKSQGQVCDNASMPNSAFERDAAKARRSSASH